MFRRQEVMLLYLLHVEETKVESFYFLDTQKVFPVTEFMLEG